MECTQFFPILLIELLQTQKYDSSPLTGKYINNHLEECIQSVRLKSKARHYTRTQRVFEVKFQYFGI